MKFLGNISHVSNSGKLIARSSQSPPTGASVFSKDKKKIGKIIDVFGPTKEPYISVGIFKSINSESFKHSSGEDLFVSDNPKNRKSNRSNNRNNKSNNRRFSRNKNSEMSNKRDKNQKSFNKDKKDNKNNKNSRNSRNNRNNNSNKSNKNNKNNKNNRKIKKRHN